MINLEVPKKFEVLVTQAHQVAIEVFRANSRKYDRAEHEYPKELDMLAAVIDGAGSAGDAGAGTVGGGNGASAREDSDATRNGSNMASLLGLIELCWGDVGLLLTMPRQGLGQAAIAAVANASVEEVPPRSGVAVPPAIAALTPRSRSRAVSRQASIRVLW